MKDFDINGKITVHYEKAKASVYCTICGRPLIYSNLDEQGNATDPQWERQNGVHYACFTAWRQQQQDKLDKENKEKEVEPISDEAMAKYAERAKHKENNTEQ